MNGLWIHEQLTEISYQTPMACHTRPNRFGLHTWMTWRYNLEIHDELWDIQSTPICTECFVIRIYAKYKIEVCQLSPGSCLQPWDVLNFTNFLRYWKSSRKALSTLSADHSSWRNIWKLPPRELTSNPWKEGHSAKEYYPSSFTTAVRVRHGPIHWSLAAISIWRIFHLPLYQLRDSV